MGTYFNNLQIIICVGNYFCSPPSLSPPLNMNYDNFVKILPKFAICPFFSMKLKKQG